MNHIQTPNINIPPDPPRLRGGKKFFTVIIIINIHIDIYIDTTQIKNHIQIPNINIPPRLRGGQKVLHSHHHDQNQNKYQYQLN